MFSGFTLEQLEERVHNLPLQIQGELAQLDKEMARVRERAVQGKFKDSLSYVGGVKDAINSMRSLTEALEDAKQELGKKRVVRDLNDPRYRVVLAALMNMQKKTEEYYLGILQELDATGKTKHKLNPAEKKMLKGAREFGVHTLKKTVEDSIMDRGRMLLYELRERVGEITHCELRPNAKMGFDGYVTGKLGRVSIETVMAGGYNIQQFHFRTLIKPA